MKFSEMIKTYYPTTEEIEEMALSNFVHECVTKKIVTTSPAKRGDAIVRALHWAGIRSIDALRKANVYEVVATTRNFGQWMAERLVELQRFINTFEEG